MSESLHVGDRVIWLYTPRGGYGYTRPVDAVVVEIHHSRATIEVKRGDKRVNRVVRLANLRPAYDIPNWDAGIERAAAKQQSWVASGGVLVVEGDV